MGVWIIDPSHSALTFAVRHLGFSKVRGRFKQYRGRIESDADDGIFGSTAVAEVDVASVDTDVADRDAHLRSAEFFDADSFPTMTFETTVIRQGADGIEVIGDINIRGVTRPVLFEIGEFGRVRDPWGNERVAFDAHGEVDRRDFGLKWNMALETGGFLVGETVEINLEIQAIKRE